MPVPKTEHKRRQFSPMGLSHLSPDWFIEEDSASDGRPPHFSVAAIGLTSEG